MSKPVIIVHPSIFGRAREAIDPAIPVIPSQYCEMREQIGFNVMERMSMPDGVLRGVVNFSSARMDLDTFQSRLARF